MLMLRRTHRRLMNILGGQVEESRRQRDEARQHGLRLTIRLELVEQARAKADSDALYWRTRCERFLDQIGAKSGIIAGPTMTEPDTPVDSHFDTVFAALGTSEINTDKGPATGAAPAAPSVTGVNAEAAQQAVNDVLAGVGR